VGTDKDSFWGRLEPGDRKAIEGHATRRRYRAGDYLCHEGDQSKHVIVLLSGHVRVLSHTVDDREVVVGIRAAGDIVGEQAALHDNPRSATLQAIDAVEAITLAGSRFVALCKNKALLSWSLLYVVSDRLREVTRHRAEYSGGSASLRVYAQLTELALRQGKRNGAGIEIQHGTTQQQLAANAATSRESYARALRELRTHGIISTGRGWIVVHRMDELQNLAR
jgi:CRP-like cAMP-binding protein